MKRLLSLFFILFSVLAQATDPGTTDRVFKHANDFFFQGGAVKAPGGFYLLDAGPLRFFDATGTNYFGLKAPTSLTASETCTLPDGDGPAGSALTTDGSCVWDWWTLFTATNDNRLLVSDTAGQPFMLESVVTLNPATGVMTGVSIDGDDNTITDLSDSSIKSGAAIARSKIASGTADHVVINDGTGALSSEATLAKVRGGTGADNSSVTFPSTGTIVTEAGAHVLTNKDIDGGTASNTRRITVPKDTKTNLDGLTRKEGTIVFDSAAKKYYGDNGTVLKSIGGSVDAWVTATSYVIGDLVIESLKFYRALTNHTSGTFATDLAALNWEEISASAAVSYTANSGLRVDATGTVESVTQTNGQILIGSTGAKPVAAALTATANQTTITNGAGTVTVGTVQDIGTGSSPTFTAVTAGVLTANSGSLPSQPCPPFTTSGAPSASGNANKCYFDTDQMTVFYSDGTQWLARGLTGGATIVAEVSFANNSGCNWQTSGSFTDYSADAGCLSPVIRGIATTSTKVPHLEVANLPAGDYMLNIAAHARAGGAAANCDYRVYDGTNGYTLGSRQGTNSFAQGLQSIPIKISTFQSTYTWKIQASLNAGAGTCDVSVEQGLGTTPEFKMSLVKINDPSSYATYFNTEATQIKWPASTTSCAASTSSGSFADMVDTDCSFAAAQKQGPVITPTTTGGVALKRAAAVAPGKYRVGFTGVLVANVGTSCAFQLTDGTNVIGPVYIDGATATVLDNIPGIPASIVTYSSATTPEWKLQAKRISGASVCEAVASDANSSMAIYMTPVDQRITATFNEVVTTPGVPSPKLVSALVTDGASTTTVSQDTSDFINGNCTNPSTGNYVCTFTSSFWPSTPHCWMQDSGGSFAVIRPDYSSTSTTSIALTGVDLAGSSLDTDFILYCKSQ